jgi:SOS response regulatory protein OraA/RecX
MKIEITSASARDCGAYVSVRAKLSDGSNFEIRELLLLASQYAELGVTIGEIDCEVFDALVSRSELCAAYLRGVAVLGYGAHSKKELARKLCQKGVTREMANGAAEMLERAGYINESDDAARLAERATKKYWGRRRISSELYARGYDADAVSSALETLEDVDFSRLCEEYIRKKYKEIPDDQNSRKKLFSALLRMGYTSSEIKEAFRAI